MPSTTEALEDMASPQAKLGPGDTVVLSSHPSLHARLRPPKIVNQTKESRFP